MKLENPVQTMTEHGLELHETGREEWPYNIICPFHNDSNPSCGINLNEQVFKCFGCGAKGDLISLIAGFLKVSRNAFLKLTGKRSGTDAVIDPVSVEKMHQRLLDAPGMLDTLLTRKGITKETVIEYGLGLYQGRVTIPVYDTFNEVVNLRMWSPTSKTSKMINFKGHGKPALYPLSATDEQTIVLTEGEMKALLLRQEGFNAISPTGGARTWSSDWNHLFSGKRVYIIYDIDQPGRGGALNAARELFSVAESVHIVKLPLEIKDFPTGGVDEYFIQMNNKAEDLQRLLDKTEPWTPVPELKESEDDLTVHKLSLAEAALAEYNGKLVETEVVVSAKDTAPYIIPAKFEVKCTQDKEICSFCPVAHHNGGPVEVKNTDPLILEMVSSTQSNVMNTLKRIAGVPKSCDSCLLDVLESYNVEELRLIPQLKVATSDSSEHIVRRAFYVGHGIETNTTYRMLGRVVAEPKTQYATLLIYEAHAAVDSLSTFQLTEPESLLMFQPKEWTKEALVEKLDQIYADLEANVTRIYERRDMHLFYDLVYHSALYLTFQERQVKGWVDALVVGDSGQGKSETVSCLLRHYGVGEKIDAKGASVAGLKGGLQETSKRWFVTWGVIPLNDRRLVVLEEIKGMAVEVISKLTDMRSSGIAEISKIEKTRTNARTRLVWISNARSDRQLMAYNYGVEAVRELIGSLEDVRRFDMVITVASGDVPRSVLNMKDEDRPQARHTYTGELCQRLILWAWSREAHQVQFTPEAIDAILAGANRMGDMFSSSIPIVEQADQRLKLARLSAALAARTFSCSEDYSTIIIRECHVEVILEFLTRVYSTKSFGYLEYSHLLKAESELHEPEVVKNALLAMPYAKDVARQLLEVPGFTVFDIMDWTECDKDLARTFISILVRKNAIKRGRNVYIKTPPFIALLKMMQLNKELHNKSLGELATEIDSEI